MDVMGKELRRVKGDCSSGFSNWADGYAKYWERKDLGRTRFITRRGMGREKKVHVKFEVIRIHANSAIRYTNLEVRMRNTNFNTKECM